MKKINLLIVMGLLLSGCSTKKYKACDVVDGSQACFIEESMTYAFEENAKIVIAGLPTSVEQPLLTVWNAEYPDYKDMIRFEGSVDETTAIQAPYAKYDIVYTYEELSGVHQEDLLELHQFLFDETYQKTQSVDVVALVLSPLQKYYIPIAYDGVAFFYNKTMLESIGVDVNTDETNDGMPDSFDSWEKIFALSDVWQNKRPIYKKKEINVVFPFSFNESYLSYFMLTGHGFRLFPNNDANDPGYLSDEFAKALGFIVEASKHPMAINGKEKLPYTSDEYLWQWEKVYTQEISPFGIVAPWMDLEGAMKANKAEFVVAPYFPTFEETSMVPFETTTGFVIKKSSIYPSAAHEVLRFLKSEKAMQVLLEANLIPFVYETHTLEFSNYPRNQAMQSTLSKADSQPLIALPSNPYKKALDSYYEIGIMSVIKQLWAQELDVAGAQAEIEQRYQAWLIENSLESQPPTTSAP